MAIHLPTLLRAAGVIIAFALAGAAAEAQTPPTEAQILEKLKTRSATRGLKAPTTPSEAAAENQLIRGIIKKGTRGLLKDDRTKVTAIADKRPNIDLEIYFDYNSAEITAKALPVLTSLGKALSSPELQGATFLVGGHTDGKGTASYNQSLSERRAEAVKQYLIREFKIGNDRLLAMGFGFERLKNAANILADENRRVQVVNFGKE